MNTKKGGVSHIGRVTLVGVLLCNAIVTSGCALRATTHVQAESGRPASARVPPPVSLPFNPAKDRIALIVEPFSSSQTISTVAFDQFGVLPVADKMSAQLTTALSKVGNFALYDYRRPSAMKPKKGERGPFIVRATLTEFNEKAEASSDGVSVSLQALGIIAGVAGAIAGKPGLMWSGAGVAAAAPTFEETTTTTTGVAALDVQIVDVATGRIVTSFEVAGKFKSESNSNTVGLFGVESSDSQVASSVIGQALRVAMNEVVEKTTQALL